MGYVGKVVNLVKYLGRPLRYMQGGLWAVNAHAARALSTCTRPFGIHDHCPNRVLTNTNEYIDRLMSRRCFVMHTSPYADDLYTGVCLHNANVTSGDEPCIQAHKRQGQSRSPRRGQGHRCRCPVSLHPLKTEDELEHERAASSNCTAALYLTEEQEAHKEVAVGDWVARRATGALRAPAEPKVKLRGRKYK